MKKVLLGTTAIVAAGMIAAPSADAAEKLKVSVGGYMEQWFGYTSADDDNSATDTEGFAIVSDTEVFFTGMTTLDNGISVGVNVQLEGNTGGDQIDESYLIVKGNFGEVNLGSENSALYKMNYGPTDYGIGINSGDQTAWVPNSIGASGGFFRSPFGSTNVEATSGDNDGEKLTYYTPRIEGFQLGVSYMPESGQDDGGIVDKNSEVTDGFAIAANFKRDFDGFNVGLSGGYGAYTDGPDGQDDPEAYSFGATFGFGGFTLGGAYAASEGTTDGDEEEGMALGVAYASGPWGVSVNYFNGESDAITAADGTITNDGEHSSYTLNGKYTLGPGITAAATLGYTELETDNTASAGNNETDGTYFVVGMKVSF